MTIESGHSAFGAFRTARSSKLYWFNIDIVLRDIYFRHRSGWRKILEPEPQLALEYCVLEGVGAVGNALTVGTEGIDFDRFVVDISGYFEAEGFPTRDDLRPPARMVWNKIEERSPRLDIYIPNNLFRHLTELYITKRIDSLQMAMLIAVTGNKFRRSRWFAGRVSPSRQVTTPVFSPCAVRTFIGIHVSGKALIPIAWSDGQPGGRPLLRRPPANDIYSTGRGVAGTPSGHSSAARSQPPQFAAAA